VRFPAGRALPIPMARPGGRYKSSTGCVALRLVPGFTRPNSVGRAGASIPYAGKPTG